MKKLIPFILFISMMLLAACGDEDTEESSEADSLTPLEAEVLIDEELEVGEASLEVRVTHGDEQVEDANEVMFEVWENGQKDASEMLEAEHTEEGIYQVDYSFETDGIYHVQPHVTARDQHVMPRHDIAVGDANLEDMGEVEETHDMDDMDDEDHSHDDEDDH
ncbi:FixH family protein [Halalkalibacillus halophilus]|uniref:FixH family protein n=1 Tax=Halalkalibacillus halophilus TaxID=392827 RepID=UPI0004113541|nr:FixH family protein [Halalkalibacillus halophilus]